VLLLCTIVSPLLFDITSTSCYSAWIKLDPQDKEKSIKTIFSNKEPGCAPGKGIALCVNTWQTNDLLLYFEYADSVKGCKSVTSGTHRMQYDKWTHVAVSAQASSAGDAGIASLYINGKEVGKLPASEQRKFIGPFAAASSTLILGGFGNMMHRFKVRRTLAWTVGVLVAGAHCIYIMHALTI
jgi:hypothetical protein